MGYVLECWIATALGDFGRCTREHSYQQQDDVVERQEDVTSLKTAATVDTSKHVSVLAPIPTANALNQNHSPVISCPRTPVEMARQEKSVPDTSASKDLHCSCGCSGPEKHERVRQVEAACKSCTLPASRVVQVAEQHRGTVVTHLVVVAFLVAWKKRAHRLRTNTRLFLVGEGDTPLAYISCSEGELLISTIDDARPGYRFTCIALEDETHTEKKRKERGATPLCSCSHTQRNLSFNLSHAMLQGTFELVLCDAAHSNSHLCDDAYRKEEVMLA